MPLTPISKISTTSTLVPSMALRRSAAPSDAVAMSALELIDDSVPMFTSVKELTSYSTYRAAIGELVGTCLFVFMVTGCPVFSAGVSRADCNDNCKLPTAPYTSPGGVQQPTGHATARSCAIVFHSYSFVADCWCMHGTLQGVSIGVTGIALNFGLSIATLAYCFGGVSGACIRVWMT